VAENVKVFDEFGYLSALLSCEDRVGKMAIGTGTNVAGELLTYNWIGLLGGRKNEGDF